MRNALYPRMILMLIATRERLAKTHATGDKAAVNLPVPVDDWTSASVHVEQ
jgi:hypothetical protein